MVSRKPSSHCRLSGCWESPAVKFKRKPPSLLHWLQGQRPQKKKPLPPRPLLAEPSDSLWDICGLPGCGLRENKGHALNRYSYPAVHIHQGPAASFFWAPPPGPLIPLAFFPQGVVPSSPSPVPATALEALGIVLGTPVSCRPAAGIQGHGYCSFLFTQA